MIGLESSPRTWDAGNARRSARLAGAFLPLRVVLFSLAAPCSCAPPERLAPGWVGGAVPGAPPMAPMTRKTCASPGAGARSTSGSGGVAAGPPRLPAARITVSGSAPRRVPVSLRFGIGEIAGRLEGHCWLALDGEPFAEPRDPRPIYTETWHPARGPA